MTYFALYFSGFFAFTGKSKKFYFYAFLFVLTLLACFRYGVGPDYVAYQHLYTHLSDSILDFKIIDGQEILFQVLGTLAKTVNLSFEAFLAVLSIVSLYFVGKTCSKFSDFPLLSLILYYSAFYFVWIFSGVRQGLVLAVGIYYLLDCSLNKKNAKFFIITLFLMFIHASAFILLVFYAISKIRIPVPFQFVLVFLCFISFPLLKNYFWSMLQYIPLATRIEFYRLSTTHFFLDSKAIIRLVLLISFGLIFINKSFLRDEKNRKIHILYVSSFGMYFSLRHVEILAQNLSIYGFLMLVLLVPNSLKSLKIKSNKNILFAIIFLFSLGFLIKNLKMMVDYSGMQTTSFLVPYTNVFYPESVKFVPVNDLDIYGDNSRARTKAVSALKK